MKLSIEIKEDKMNFSYKVGTSEMEGSLNLDAERFVVFGKMLCDLMNAENKRHKKLVEEITAKAWIENNLKDAIKFITTDKPGGINRKTNN